ncbi:MAG TPA: Rrf2 family transcriptional regulator [Acidisarcina sp.]|nr:Rrf2 family transcriptional regulator [Acidisarcina sp.]
MAVNCRFATGVHALVLLAAEPEILQTSNDIARKLNTNPVVIRRVLAALQKAELVSSQKGPSGGSRLSRPAKSITLREIYRAVENGPIFHSPELAGAAAARVGTALEKVFAESQDALESELERTTLAQLLKKLSRKGKK